MASRDLDRATPKMRIFIKNLILEAWRRYKLRVIVTSVEREIKEQAALYAQGREELEAVNVLRMVAGLLPISKEENEHCVTWTMRSEHLVDLGNETAEDDFSHAVDVAILKKNGEASWSLKADVNGDQIADYLQLVKLAQQIDPTIVCGGNWKKPDYPHFQDRPVKRKVSKEVS